MRMTAEILANRYKCHCGAPVTARSHPDLAGHMNAGLSMGYCIDCCLVRCDAYPGACATEDGGRVFSGQNATTPAYGSPRAPSPEVTEK